MSGARAGLGNAARSRASLPRRTLAVARLACITRLLLAAAMLFARSSSSRASLPRPPAHWLHVRARARPGLHCALRAHGRNSRL